MSERDPYHTRPGENGQESLDPSVQQDSEEAKDKKKKGEVVSAVVEAIVDIAAEIIDAIT